MGRREEKAEHTRRALITEAMRLFREGGYDTVSVEEITKAAGVAKGTFYSYFETKSAIIVEEFWTIDRFYEEFAVHRLPGCRTAAEKLLAFTDAQMTYVRDQVGVENLQILYANQVRGLGAYRVIVDPKRQWYRIVEGVIREGRETGEFRTEGDPAELARLFNRSMRSVFLDWCIADGGFDLVEVGVRYCREWMIPVLVGGAGDSTG